MESVDDRIAEVPDADDIQTDGLFDEPEGYYQTEKAASTATHILRSGEIVTLRLVGHNPLWGHLLWNAGRVISDYLEDHADALVVGKDVLELGAGAGLPSLVSASVLARKVRTIRLQVVVTDYPDEDLIDNLRYNIKHWSARHKLQNIQAEGYLWGAPIDALSPYLDAPSEGFDLLILADVLFNHSEHGKLVSTVSQALKKTPSSTALVFFTPYRPWLLDKDLAFFDLARGAGFQVEEVLEQVMDKVMFDEDPGDERVRRTVYGYTLRWP